MSKEAIKLALEALEHMLEDAKQERLTVEYWNECVDAITALREALAEQPAQQQDADHEFKNFHHTMCERFGYTHDERDWKRDQVSLIEWIAKKVEQPALEQQEPMTKIISNLEPLLAAKNQSWAYAEKMLLELLAAAPQPAQQEPKCGAIIEVFGKDWRLDYMSLPVGKHKLYTQQCTYTAPAQRTWVGLKDEELSEVYNKADWDTVNGWEYERAIEAKLKEKNNG